MIEEIILAQLAAAGISAVMEIPEGGGTLPFCVVQKTGGGSENHIRRATVAIQSYAASLYGAATLNEQVIAAMESITERSEVGSCELNSDYNYPDGTTKQYRYQAVFDIVYYD